jgi:5,10-methylenetetrahydromethanopterin reductase
MARFGMMITCNRLPEELVDSAQYMESLGFDDVWLVEDLRWAGGIGPSAVVLASTQTVRVGLGIMPAVFRNASATAMEVSALARLFPGRFAAGIGHGLQSWMSQIGERVASPMTAIEEVTSVVRKMIRGGSVSFGGMYVKVDDIALVHPAIEVPPVLLGVTGPKSVELSGRIADGTILSEWVGPAYVKDARVLINRGRATAGQVSGGTRVNGSQFEPAAIADKHELVVFVNTMLSSEFVDARMVMRQSIAPKVLDGSLARAFALMGVTEEADRLAALGLPAHELADKIPDAWIDELAAAGTAEQIQTMFRALIDAGADTIVMIPFVGKHDPELARYAAILEPLRS